MSNHNLNALRERWVTEASGSDLGLWWLANDVRETIGAMHTEEQIRDITLELLKPLLDDGSLRVVDVLPDGSFAAWSGESDAQLARIESSWRSLGHKPGLGDVAWFIGRRELRTDR
jgi:hypothetical protein